jgi:hypothetical protein
MCRKKSVWQVLQEFRSERAATDTDVDIELSNIDSSARGTAVEAKIREEFERNIELFFSKMGGETYHNQPSALEPESASECADECADEDEAEAKADIEIPSHWRAVYSITDEEQDVIVTTFDTQIPAGF